MSKLVCGAAPLGRSRPPGRLPGATPPLSRGLAVPPSRRPAVSPSRCLRAGFTLLEMIVATAVMSIAVVGLLSLLSATLSNAARVQQYDRAAMLARTKMNELLLLSPLPLGQPMGGQWDATSGWTARAEVFERRPDAAPGMLQLVRLHLEVWWMADQRRKSVTLDGFRREIIPREGLR